MYHYVRDTARTEFPDIRALSPRTFEQQLDWLQERHEIVGAAAVEAALAGAASLPERAALLTFDDGFVDHFETVLPILRTRGLSGIFFVSGATLGPAPRMLGVHKTHFLLARLGADTFGKAVLATCASATLGDAARARVFGADAWERTDERAIKKLLNYELSFEDSERVLSELFAEHIGDESAFARALYLNEAQIAEMASAGLSFGYHTQTHRMLSRLDAADQRAELLDGPARIAALTGQDQVSFCYPWGGTGTYTSDTLAILGEAGYSMAFNTVRREAQLGVDGRFELPRVDTRDLPPHQ